MNNMRDTRNFSIKVTKILKRALLVINISITTKALLSGTMFHININNMLDC